MIFACSIYSWLERLIKRPLKLNENSTDTSSRTLFLLPFGYHKQSSLHPFRSRLNDQSTEMTPPFGYNAFSLLVKTSDVTFDVIKIHDVICRVFKSRTLCQDSFHISTPGQCVTLRLPPRSYTRSVLQPRVIDKLIQQKLLLTRLRKFLSPTASNSESSHF